MMGLLFSRPRETLIYPPRSPTHRPVASTVSYDFDSLAGQRRALEAMDDLKEPSRTEPTEEKDNGMTPTKQKKLVSY